MMYNVISRNHSTYLLVALSIVAIWLELIGFAISSILLIGIVGAACLSCLAVSTRITTENAYSGIITRDPKQSDPIAEYNYFKYLALPYELITNNYHRGGSWKQRPSYNSEQQRILELVSHTALQPITLQEKLTRVLTDVASIPLFNHTVEHGCIVTVQHNTCTVVAMTGVAGNVLNDWNQMIWQWRQHTAGNNVIFFMSDQFDHTHQIPTKHQTNGYYCQPVIYGEQLMAMLALHVTRTASYDVTNDKFLSTIANSVAGMIEHHRLQNSLLVLSKTVEKSPVSIIVTDTSGNIEQVNPYFAQTSGYTELEVIGKNPKLLKSGEMNQSVYTDLWQTVTTGKDWCGELCNKNKQGNLYWEYAYISPVRNTAGNIDHFIAIKEDITEQKEAEEAIVRMSLFDELTGLPNRTSLLLHLKNAVTQAQRQNEHIALLVIDLDNFKEVNEALGHDKGDLILKLVAQRLQHVLRGSDVIARPEGDEFAILLTSMSESEDATRVSKKILQAMEMPFITDGLSLDMRPNIGIALYPEHGDTAELLLQHADIAMHSAQQAKQGMAIYQMDHTYINPRRLSMMGELRKAIMHGGLKLHYQPKVDMITGHTIGAEALLRWQHPELGNVSPDEFIPLAEQTGLIRPLTQWVINETLHQSLLWQQEGIDLCIAINLSACNLSEKHLPKIMDDLLDAWEISPNRINIEITETAMMGEPEQSISILSNIHKMGINLSIDDYGTGYSSLAYLKKLPIESIKIDRSFVKDMCHDENDDIIVRSTINLAHSLGFKVIAEGVEDKATWDQLVAMGCDIAQGYYMSKPLPGRDILPWLQHSQWGHA